MRGDFVFGEEVLEDTFLMGVKCFSGNLFDGRLEFLPANLLGRLPVAGVAEEQPGTFPIGDSILFSADATHHDWTPR
jgi:hypothetical protein